MPYLGEGITWQTWKKETKHAFKEVRPSKPKDMGVKSIQNNASFNFPKNRVLNK